MNQRSLKSRRLASIAIVIIICFSLILILLKKISHSFLVSQSTPTQACQATGCFNRLCLPTSSKVLPGQLDCQPQATDTCLTLTQCELQANNSCGFTPTPAYQNCLQNQVATDDTLESSLSAKYKLRN